jgi:acetyltransferase-like isoleucine patch superfamily enzyme
MSQVVYRQFFGALGHNSKIVRPLQLRNLGNIRIGSGVLINAYCWLMTLETCATQRPAMLIGDGAIIGHFNHITCTNRVEIGRRVLTADRVHISDNSHDYDNPEIAIRDQRIVSKGPVVIGDGSWLGENVSVLSCSVGRNCVIGANSVVTRDIPDFSVAVGAPARVIKQFDQHSRKWLKVS